MLVEQAIKKHLDQLAPHIRERESAKLLEAALKELKDRRVRFTFAMPTPDQCAEARMSNLYQHGDMKLVWINEGDLILSGNESS